MLRQFRLGESRSLLFVGRANVSWSLRRLIVLILFP